MSRRFTPKIVTANDLRVGDVVYLTADDRWSPPASRGRTDRGRGACPDAPAARRGAEAGRRRRLSRRCQGRARTAPSPRISARNSAPAARRTTSTASRPSWQLRQRMYDYSDFDEAFVRARVAQFTDQVDRRLDGSLTEDEFRPLRLMNGLYLQLHAYMLRVAIPYGTLNPRQMRQLAHDRRHLGQGLWPLHHAAEHPVQLAEAARRARHPVGAGRCGDARHPDLRQLRAQRHRRPFRRCRRGRDRRPAPRAELLRQWSTDHPEFQFLPRKFKIAITGSPNDRAVTKAHDIGLRMVRNAAGEPGFEVIVGGGLGRTPMIGHHRARLPARRPTCCPMSRRSSASTTRSAGATTSTRRASRSPCTRPAWKKSPGMIEDRFAELRPLFGGDDQALLAEIARRLRAPGLPRCARRCL